MDHLSLASLGFGPGNTVPPPHHPLPCNSSNGNVNGNGNDRFGTNPHTSTTPQLVYQSASTAIYRLQNTGIKVSLVSSMSTEEEQIRRLLHEQNISKFLPSSCNKREVIDVTSFNRRPAMTFKWTDGITMKEWLQGAENFQLDLSVRIRAAASVAKMLAEFHEGGVVYNGLSPDNIVLTMSNDNHEQDYVATFIDLSGAAIICSNRQSSSNDNAAAVAAAAVDAQTMKEGDLKGLGLMLNLIFQGGNYTTNNSDFNNNGGGGGSMANNNETKEDELLPDWIEIGDAEGDGGPTYYVNKVTMATSWERPSRGKIKADETTSNSLITSNNNNNGSEDQFSRPKRGKPSQQTSGGEGLPLYLDSLISTLLAENSGGGDTNGTAKPSLSSDLSYKSAKDVYYDLKVLLESPGNGDCLRKCKPDEWTAKGRLRLQGDNIFYGRQVQMSMLVHLVQSGVKMGSQPLMATVSGYPGTGKSTLVRNLKTTLSLTTNFIEGKFVKSARPDTILASALDSFFGKVINANQGDHIHTSMRWRIHDAIGSGNNSALLEILPNLQKWLDEGNDTGTEDLEKMSKAIGSSHRLKFMFCKLISAIACKGRPLILFLDDLQWADDTTLDIIRMVMTDPDTHHFFFLGSYRDNEVGESHPLTAKLKGIQEQGIRIVAIKVGPIEKDFVTALLSETMCLPLSLCRPLAGIVHSKTGGIIMFILRFLASLNDEGLLWYSMSSRRWMFDLQKIRQKEVNGDVVSHMTQHMTRLSKKMQTGLKVAACLGPLFDAKTLERAKKENDDDLLGYCVENGFLQSIGDDKYVWAHDQIQQAAYDLIPRSKRESFHLLLGSRLFMKTSSSEIEDMIFVVVDNLNRGSHLIDDQNQKYEVVHLNLRAGEKALSTSAFHSASKYLMAGLSFLGPKSWEEKYNLTINLYDAASMALFITGDFARLSTISEKPLTHAESFEDKLNIYNNVVRALSATTKFEEGISTCVFVLAQLGVKIPSDITADVYQDEVTQVKKLLEGKSESELLSLPILVGKKKLAAMQFMNHALIMTFIAKPSLNPIIVFRMIKMSVEHGICSISAFAFGCYGAWLVSEPSFDVDQGYRMGRVAIEMMKRLNAVEMIPRVYTTVYSFINIWKEPWQACLSKHMESYESGAKTGDLEYAISGFYQHCDTAIYGCGENLVTLSEKMPAYVKWAYQYNQIHCWKSLVVLNQLNFDLMGISQNAFAPYVNGTTEESCLTSARENNEISICRLICQKRKYVSFFTGDLSTAAKMYDICEEYNKVMGPTGRLVSAIVGMFINGMIGFFLARNEGGNDGNKWFNIGQDAIQSMRKWATTCSEWNFSNKLSLLEAEYHFMRGRDDQAVSFYEASIKAAQIHKFVHEEGLANEKFATYLLSKSKYQEAMEAFTNAKRCYERWGAHILVTRMEKAVGLLLPLINGSE